MDDAFDLDSDDITDLLSAEDLESLENEAWRKAKILENNAGVENKESVTCNLDLTREQASQSFRGLQTGQLASELEEYKLKVQELQDDLCMKDGQLKIVRHNLDACRKEISEKDKMIAQVRKEQAEERSERNCKLSREVKNLKTQLSFQKHELMKLETLRIQSQTVSNSQNLSNNSQNVSYSQKVPVLQKVSGSEKLSGSVKRKAEVPNTSPVFDLDNSFHSSNISCPTEVPQGKIPRLERKNDLGEVDFKSFDKQCRDRKTNLSCKPSTSKMNNSSSSKKSESSRRKPSSSLREVNTNCEKCSCNELLGTRIVNLSEKKAGNLVRKLVLSYTLDTNMNDESQDFETISLLNLLKYPLKHLPDVLKAHSVDGNLDQSLSQFPKWQTQVQAASSGAVHLSPDEELDFDSGKYNLVSQGIFLLLGLSPFTANSVESLGVIHVLVFLELYLTSYILMRQGTEKLENKTDANNSHQECPTNTRDEAVNMSFDEQDVVLLTLQIFQLLFYSTPGLVHCVLNRTNPEFLKDDVIVVYDSNKDKTEKFVKKEENAEVCEEEGIDGIGSFHSLLLNNLLKLITFSDINLSLTVCHASLEVLIAITAVSNIAQLESMFIPLNCGCLVNLVAKVECTMLTVSLVMQLLSNFLPCKDVHKMLCSHTDDCILLKIYQCACDEEDDDEGVKFLQQFFKFLMKVAYSHGDSIEFLLESECQCSFEIIHCLVLVLYDKVKYLLDLETDRVVEDNSLGVVRNGINILVILCTHTSYLSDHKLHVEHEFIELIYKSMILFKNIRAYMPELEALALQDLLDMETVDELEWSSGSENEDKDDDDMVLQ